MTLAVLDSPSQPDTDDRQGRFDSLYREHYGRVLAYALRRCAPDVANDIVADTFLVAWRRLDRVPNDPLPWLLGVARKTLATHRRSAKRRGALVRELKAQAAVGSGREAVTDARAGAIAEAVARLGEHGQELLKLVVWDGLTTKDAAAVMGISHVAARARLHRVKRKLAAELERDEELDRAHYSERLGEAR